MTNIKNVFYHIQKPGLERLIWEKGDIVDNSNLGINSFYSGLIHDIQPKSLGGKGLKLIEHSCMINNQDLNQVCANEVSDYKTKYYKCLDNSFAFENLAISLHNSLFQYLKWVREETFEKTRLKINPNLPSRKQCIWVTKKTEVEIWWKMFNDTPNKTILQLELMDLNSLHKGDGELIQTETFKIKDYEDMAQKYWEGEILSDKEPEYSYVGKFKVLNKFTDINEL